MTPQEKKFWEEQDRMATVFMKGMATAIIATLVIAGMGLIISSSLGI
jgi:hypothetical protein